MYVDKQAILDATNGGLDIILHYFPEAEKVKHFRDREDDTTPSTCIKQCPDGNWIVTDFGGDAISRNGITLTMIKEKCSFKDALHILADRYKIESTQGKSFKIFPEIKGPFKSPEGTEPGYVFHFKDNFTEEELFVLGPYVKEEHCMKFNLKSVKMYQYHFKDGTYKEFHSTENFPIFCFNFPEWQKIYQPLASDKKYRFRYNGKRPKDYIFGRDLLNRLYEKLEQEDQERKPKDKLHKLPEVVLCSGDRDALNMASLGYNVVWLNSESAKLSEFDFNNLKYKCHDVYNLPDLDTTGKKQALEKAFEHIDLKTIWLPEYIKERKDRRGNPCKDFTDFCKYFRSRSWKKLDADVKTLMNVAMPTKFWSKYVTKNNIVKYSYNTEYALNFFAKSGYYRFEAPETKEGYFYVHINNNIVKKIEPSKTTEIKTYVLNWARSRKFPIPVVNLIHDNTSKFNDSNINSLPFVNIDFSDNDEFSQYYFFRNETWKITKDGIKAAPNKDVDKYVWKDRVIDKEVKIETPYFKISQDKDGDFDIEILKNDCQFLNYLINTSRVHWRYELEDRFKGENAVKDISKEDYFKQNQFNISGPNFTNHKDTENNELGRNMILEQKLHLINKLFSIGYLLHGYKNADKAWAVFAMDNRLSAEGKSFGGSGKSLLYEKIIPFFLGKFFLNGRDRKLFDNAHVYDGLTKHNKYVIFEDADQYFKFNNLFAPVTSDWQVNPKNNTQYTIKFSDSGKIAITSNFTLINIDGSTERRILYTVFSDYYHHKGQEGGYLEDRTVGSDFNNTQFLIQWSDEEYNKFINVCMQCLQFFLATDRKHSPPMNNVVKRNLLTEMTSAFKDWADVFFHSDTGRLNDYVLKDEIVENAISQTKNNKLTSNTITRRLKAWCKYYGYVLDPDELTGKDGRIMKYREGKTRALHYIQTVPLEEAEEYRQSIKRKKQNELPIH